MTAPAIVLAALLLGEPPVTYPSDSSWSACQTGEPASRVEGCGRIANDPALDLPARSWALVLRAAARADANDREGAIADLDRAVRMDPTNWIGYRLKGDLELELERFDAALSDIDTAIEINPADPYSLLSKAIYFRTRGDFAQARKTIDQAIGLDPYLAEPYFERGRIAIALHDAVQAMLDFEKFRSMRPDEPVTDYNLAIAYRMAGQLLDADTAIGRALDGMPKDVDSHMVRAAILRDLGEPDAALAEIETAIALAPANLSLVYDRGNIHTDLGAWVAAIADFTTAMPAYPNDPAILVNRGYAHFRNNEDEKALADADAALAIDGKYADAYWLKGSALLYLERHEDALEAAEKGLKEGPDDVRFLILRGRVFLSQGSTLTALIQFSGAIAKDSHSTEAVIYNAAALAKLGMTESALGTLHRILESDPNNALALEQIVPLQRAVGDFEGALSNLGRLTEQWPNVPFYWWDKGGVLVQLEYYGAAPDAYQQAMALYGEDVPLELLRDVGASLVQAARFQEAIDALKAALDKEPDDAWTIGELGVAELGAGEDAQASVDLKRAVALYAGKSGVDYFRLNLGDSYAALEDYRSALDEYDQVLLDYPTDAETLSKRGAAYRNLMRDSAATVAADEHAREPDFLRYLFSKVDDLRQKGDFPEGLALLDKAIEAAPDAAHSYFLRAWLRRQTKDYALALEDLDRVLELDPVSASVLNNRADILLLMGRIEDARATAKQATSKYPDDGTSWVTFGQILIETNDLHGAVVALSKGIEHDPASKADAYFYRAMAYFRLGQAVAARSDLALAARFDDGELASQIAELRLKLS